MLSVLAILMNVVAVALGWKLCRQRPDHRPVAAWLGGSLLADVLGLALRVLYVSPNLPYDGWRRALFHVDEFLWLGGCSMGFAVVVWQSWMRRSAKTPMYAWGGIWLLMIATYPELRGVERWMFYLTSQLLVLAATSYVAIGVLIARTYAAHKARMRGVVAEIDVSYAEAVLCIGSLMLSFDIGAAMWSVRSPLGDWRGPAVAIPCYGLMAVIQWAALRNQRGVSGTQVHRLA